MPHLGPLLLNHPIAGPDGNRFQVEQRPSCEKRHHDALPHKHPTPPGHAFSNERQERDARLTGRNHLGTVGNIQHCQRAVRRQREADVRRVAVIEDIRAECGLSPELNDASADDGGGRGRAFV